MCELVDLPCFGRPTRLVWHKHRWRCPEASCLTTSWIGEELRIGAPRQAMTDRAGRWVTEQVGRYARSVNEVAIEIGCGWHTINDTVIAYGTALVDDPNRFGTVDVNPDNTRPAPTTTAHRATRPRPDIEPRPF
jgi:transposase